MTAPLALTPLVWSGGGRGAGIVCCRLAGAAQPAGGGGGACQAPLVRTLQFSARRGHAVACGRGQHHHRPRGQVLVTEGAQVRQGDVLLGWRVMNCALRWRRPSLPSGRPRRAWPACAARAARRRAPGWRRPTPRCARRRPSCCAPSSWWRRALSVPRGWTMRAARWTWRRPSAPAHVPRPRPMTRQRHRCAPGPGAAGRWPAPPHSLRVPGWRRRRCWRPLMRACWSRQVEPGQIVQPGKALMSLALAGPAAAGGTGGRAFSGPAANRPEGRRGGRRFCRPALRRSVLTIAPAVDAQRGAVEVKFALTRRPPAYLREDMTLSVEVETARRERALVLPLAALRAGTSARPARPAVRPRRAGAA
jgi:HlyD family secretion protein